MWLRKKMKKTNKQKILKRLIRFHSANKIDNYNKGWGERKEKIQKNLSVQFSSVQSLSCFRLFAIPWIAVHQASPSIINSEFTQTHIHRVDDAIQSSQKNL